MPLESELQRFTRGLLAPGDAKRQGEYFVLPDGRAAAAEIVLGLIGQGVLAGGEEHCQATSQTRDWLKRAMLDPNPFAAQHRVVATTPEGPAVNLAESALARLGSGAIPFLQRHHLEAGERIRGLVERAQLQPRLTMSYSASRIAGTKGHKNDISDLAADARKVLARIYDRLPPDCAAVVVDVCGYLKRLQEVERDRGWPRRSAKLVLRIGLEQAAQLFGMDPVAVGATRRRTRQWLAADARPHMGRSASDRAGLGTDAADHGDQAV